MRAGRYWMRLSRFLTIAASWSTSRAARLPQAVLHVRPSARQHSRLRTSSGARPCARGGCGPGRTGGPARRAAAHQPRDRHPPRALAAGRDHGGMPAAGPGAGLRRAGSARPRPRSRSTPRSSPLASYLRPRLPPPGGDLRLIPLRRPVHRDLRGSPDAVQQVRRAAQRVPDMEQPADQRRDPGRSR